MKKQKQPPQEVKITENERGLFMVINFHNKDSDRIPKQDSPTYIHSNYLDAYNEAERLSSSYIGHPYAIVKVVGFLEAVRPKPTFRNVTEADIESCDIPF